MNVRYEVRESYIVLWKNSKDFDILTYPEDSEAIKKIVTDEELKQLQQDYEEKQRRNEEWQREFNLKVEPLRSQYLSIKDRIDYEETCDVEIEWVPFSLGREPGKEDWLAEAKPKKLDGITDTKYLRNFIDWLDVEEAMEDGIIQAFLDYYNRLLKLYETHDRIKVTYNEEAKQKLRKAGLENEIKKVFYVFRRKKEK